MVETFAFDELVARVRHTIERSSDLLEWSDRLRVTSRRLCRPRIRGGSDSNPNRVERTLDKTRRGALPSSFDSKVWVGPGSGTECNGCGERIDAQEREVELDFSAALTFRFHDGCYRVWATLSRGQRHADGDGTSNGHDRK